MKDCGDCVDVVIVNWNAGDYLAKVVESLKAIEGEGLGKIIVVDNASTDGSPDLIAAISGVELVYAGENLGFGKACNLGARRCTAEYLLFLNPDSRVFPDTLDKTIAFMRDPKNTDVGICGVQLVDKHDHVARSCSRFPTPLGFLAQALGLVRLVPRLGHFMAEWSHDTTREVDQVIGAFFFVRRALFDHIGGFDERYFVYFEEVDFSFRAKKAGWKSIYLADAQAFHAGGGTSSQVKARRLFYYLRSRILYAFKNFSVGGALLVLFATLLLEPISRSALSLSRRSWSAIKEVWLGYGMLWRWIPEWIFKGSPR